MIRVKFDSKRVQFQKYSDELYQVRELDDDEIEDGETNPTVYYFYNSEGNDDLELWGFKILRSDQFYFIGTDTQFGSSVSTTRSFLMKNDFSMAFDEADQDFDGEGQNFCIDILTATDLTLTLNSIETSKLLDLESILESREFATVTRWRITDEMHTSDTRSIIPLEQVCETDL